MIVSQNNVFKYVDMALIPIGLVYLCRTVWNYLCIIQSMVIQIMMLICYVAPGMKGFKDLPEDAPLPNEIYE